jgi:hypothetical protein
MENGLIPNQDREVRPALRLFGTLSQLSNFGSLATLDAVRAVKCQALEDSLKSSA